MAKKHSCDNCARMQGDMLCVLLVSALRRVPLKPAKMNKIIHLVEENKLVGAPLTDKEVEAMKFHCERNELFSNNPQFNVIFKLAEDIVGLDGDNRIKRYRAGTEAYEGATAIDTKILVCPSWTSGK